MKTKTIKTPLMMDEVFDLTSCSSGFVRKSTLLHKPEAQYSLVPKLIHHKWQKQSPFGLKNQECSLCTERVFCFSGSSEPMFLLFSGCNSNGVDGVAGGFYLCACTQGKTYSHNIKDKVLTWKKGYYGFCKNAET